MKDLRRPRILRAFHPWRGAMGWFKPLNLAVLGVAVVAAVMTTDFYLRGPGALPARYPPLEIGPWRLGATLVAGLGDTSDPVKPGARVMALINYCSGCWDGIRQLALHIGTSPPSPDQSGIPVFGQPGYAYARITLPAELGSQQRLWLIAEGWDRQRHVAGWPIVRPPANAQP